MYQIKRSFEIDAAHRVPLHESKCRNLHGHRYKIDVYLTYEKLDEKGFVMDFGQMKEVFGSWLDENWDHGLILQASDPLWGTLREKVQPPQVINQKLFFMVEPPTAECMAKFLHSTFMELAKPYFRDTDFKLDVVVYETPNCSARWPA